MYMYVARYKKKRNEFIFLCTQRQIFYVYERVRVHRYTYAVFYCICKYMYNKCEVIILPLLFLLWGWLSIHLGLPDSYIFMQLLMLLLLLLYENIHFIIKQTINSKKKKRIQ